MDKNTFQKSIAEQVKLYRDKFGLSQSDLANRMNVPQPAIARLEKGEGISSLTLARVCSALGLKLEFSEDTSNNTNKPSDINEIVEYVLWSAKELLNLDYDVSNMKLNKLLYYIQMISIGKYNLKMFEEKIEAWKHGPVISVIYHKYKDNASNAITPPTTKPNVKLSVTQIEIIEEVIKRYGSMSAYQLRNLTHSEMPWQNAKDRETSNEISFSDMKTYFNLLNYGNM